MRPPRNLPLFSAPQPPPQLSASTSTPNSAAAAGGVRKAGAAPLASRYFAAGLIALALGLTGGALCGAFFLNLDGGRAAPAPPPPPEAAASGGGVEKDALAQTSKQPAFSEEESSAASKGSGGRASRESARTQERAALDALKTSRGTPLPAPASSASSSRNGAEALALNSATPVKISTHSSAAAPRGSSAAAVSRTSDARATRLADSAPVDLERVRALLPAERRGRAINRVTLSRPWVALSFDDGPTPGSTGRILDELERRGAGATFFLLGERAEQFPALAGEIGRRGFETGNHSFSHPDMRKLDAAGTLAEFARADETFRAAGLPARAGLIRFPFGACNTPQREAVAGSGRLMIGWDVDSNDWRRETNEAALLRTVETLAKPGSILLFHDRSKPTADALPAILDKLEAMGLRPVSVGRLLAANVEEAASAAPAK